MNDRDKRRRRTGEGTISLECMTMQTILALASLNEIGRLKDCVGVQALCESCQSVEPYRLSIEKLDLHLTPYTIETPINDPTKPVLDVYACVLVERLTMSSQISQTERKS
jgi:hypothetical protein